MVTARITTWGGSSSSAYEMTIITDEGTFDAQVSGNGTVTLSTGLNSFLDGSTIFFEIQKSSGTNFQEAVGYDVTYQVHDLGIPLPADPTFTQTIVTSSAQAWFYGQPETFTAQVNNASPGGTTVPAGSAQFQIDGANVGQPVAAGCQRAGHLHNDDPRRPPAHRPGRLLRRRNHVPGERWRPRRRGDRNSGLLTITPDANQSMIYGAAVPVLNYSASGFVNNDPPSTLIGVLGTAATAASPVGNYAFATGSLTAGGNYSVVLEESPPTFAVNPATPTITWANPGDITYGTALSATQLDATASWMVAGVVVNVPGSLSYTPAAREVLAPAPIRRSHCPSHPPT